MVGARRGGRARALCGRSRGCRASSSTPPRSVAPLSPGRRRRHRRALRARRRRRTGGGGHARVPRSARARPPPPRHGAGRAQPPARPVPPRAPRRVPGHRPDPVGDRCPPDRRRPPTSRATMRRGLRPVPGRLFVVGDPKQSIYRFRRADIAIYLAAADHVDAEREVLSANFRSTDGGHRLGQRRLRRRHPARDRACSRRTARSTPAGPARATTAPSTSLGATLHDDVDAQALRGLEAESSPPPSPPPCATVARGRRRRRPAPVPAGDIAMLLPARTSLPMLEPALDRAGRAVPGRERVGRLRRARDPQPHARPRGPPPTRPTSWRSLPPCARRCTAAATSSCTTGSTAGGRWSPFARPPDGDGGPPGRRRPRPHRGRWPAAVGRSTPAELLDRSSSERRVLETALAGPDARDVWRRVRYVVDQARAWTDAGGRGLRRYLRWAAYQAAEGRASDTILPERDHDAVRIMTVHAAKGLEFPITVVSGLTTKPAGQPSLSVVWRSGTWMLAERDNDVFQEYKPLDEQMGDAERRRLLVRRVHARRRPSRRVAAPQGGERRRRAGHRQGDERDGAGRGWRPRPRRAPARRRRRSAHPAGRRRARVAVVGPRRVGRGAPPGHGRRRRCARRRAPPGLRHGHGRNRRRRGQPRLGTMPGLPKDAVDLDLPPWQRGRYGTADRSRRARRPAGRRPADGRDIDELAAAQCAAEGIFGFEPRVAALSRSALAAPIVAPRPVAPSTGGSCSSSPSSAPPCSRATSTCSCARPTASSSSTTRPTSGRPAPT